MLKKIKSIETEANITIVDKNYQTPGIGVRIIYDDGSFTEFGIESGQDCCEVWDYLYSPDSSEQFIGATVHSIEEVNTWPESIEKVDSYDELGFQAIRVNTNKGQLDFVVYNDHNGYYSHATIFRNEGVAKEGRL